jgi:hypothetical protein
MPYYFLDSRDHFKAMLTTAIAMDSSIAGWRRVEACCLIQNDFGGTAAKRFLLIYDQVPVSFTSSCSRSSGGSASLS